MIERVCLRNIRVFAKESWGVKCAPLTIFTGVNSAGKSTILKIPLLLKQTQEIGNTSTWPAGKMLLSGDELDLGDYDSLISTGMGDQGFSLGIDFRAVFPVNNLRPALTQAQVEKIKNMGDEIELKVSWQSDFIRESDHGKDASLEKATLALYLDEENIFQISVSKNTSAPATGKYTMHFPAKYFENLQADKVLKTELDTSKSVRSCMVQMASCLPTNFETIWLKHNIPGAYPLPPLITDMVRVAKKELEALHYIGPFRAPGSRYYMTRGALAKLDSIGNFVPYILKNNSNDEIVYIPPGTDTEIKSGKLNSAINEWLNFFRTGDSKTLECNEFEFQPSNAIFGELRLRSAAGESTHALVDSGFGYSQIFPIIVRALMAKPGETIIIEQPELHLNPALQVRCAIFLYRMMKSGRRVIVETHSEHLVNMLRVLAVENDDMKDVLIHFFEATDGGIKCLEMVMDKYGNFETWPKSFFGEALDLSARLIKAQAKKAKKDK